MTNQEFIKVLKTFITSNNNYIDKMFTLKIINNKGIPNILIRTTNDRDELHILSLQINFISNMEEHINEFLTHYVKDADSRDEFKTVLVKALYEIQKQVAQKLKKKENKNHGNNTNTNTNTNTNKGINIQ